MLESDFLDHTALEADEEHFDHDGHTHPKTSIPKKKLPASAAESNKLGASNAGLRLLDACYDDLAYARFLLRSKNPRDLQIRHKVNWKDQNSGNSIIHCLVYSDLVEPVKLLLNHDANPNITNKHDETPLHWCAKMNSMKCAKVLIESKGDVDAVDNSGSTPLHYAAMMENVEIVVLLLDSGANAQITDGDNNTAMELAAEGKGSASKAILVIFQRHFERLKIPFPRSIRLKMTHFNPIQPNDSNNVEIVPSSAPASASENLVGIKRPQSPSKTAPADAAIQRSKSKTQIAVNAVVAPPRSPPPKTIYDQIASGEMKSQDHPPRPLRSHASQPVLLSTSQTQLGLSRPASASTLRHDSPGNSSSRPMSATRSVGGSSPLRSTLTDPKSQTPVFSVRHVERPLTPDMMRANDVVTVRHANAQDLERTVIRPASANNSPNKQKMKQAEISSKALAEEQELQNRIEEISKAFEQQQTVTGTGTSKLINPGPSGKQQPVVVAPVSRENIAELVFPPADMVPFLPGVSSRLGEYNPSHLDVIVEVEHCCDCHLHDQSLRHDPKKYIQVANAILYSLIKTLASSRLAVRLYALRSKPVSEKRAGAFEVTVAIRLNFPNLEDAEPGSVAPTPSGRQKKPSFVVSSPAAATRTTPTAAGKAGDKKDKVAVVKEKEKMRPSRWASHKIFSKLQSKSWPSISNLEQKTIAFLHTTLKDAYRDRNVVYASQMNMDYVPNPQDDVENMAEYQKATLTKEEIKAIQSSYDQWMERMKIPPKVERDPLDLDFPTGLFEAEAEKKKKPPASGASLLQQFIAHDPPQGMSSIVTAQQEHPAGPYLDVKLAQTCSKEDFEKLTLRHFFVFDNRFPESAEEEEDEAVAAVEEEVVALQEPVTQVDAQPKPSANHVDTPVVTSQG